MSITKSYPLNSSVKEKAQMLAIAGEPTRLRILCLLMEHEDVCVSEIAKSVNASVAVVSHHLQCMKDCGWLDDCRSGQTICYKLKKENKYIKKLKSIICE